MSIRPPCDAQITLEGRGQAIAAFRGGAWNPIYLDGRFGEQVESVQKWCVHTRPSVLLTAAGHRDRAHQLASATPQHAAAVLAAAAPEVLTSREQPNRQLAATRDQERTRNAVDVWEALADATWTQTASAASYLLFGGVAAGVVPHRALLRTFSLSRPRDERDEATSPAHQPLLGSWLGWDLACDVAADAVATVAWRAVVDLASQAGPIWGGPARARHGSQHEKSSSAP